MKNLKNYLKNGLLIVLCVVFFSTNVLAMRSPEGAAQSASRGLQQRLELQRKLELQRESHHENQYFLYGQDDPNNGIWVDKEFVTVNCGALKNMIADFGSAQEVKIPIFGYPIAVIKLGFDVLANKVNVSSVSSKELIDVVNLFNFLGASVDKMKTVLDRVLENLNNIPDQELKNLNADVQKLLMTDSAINYLKDCIIKKYAHERKQILEGHQRIVHSVAVSADGKWMVSGSAGSNNNLILWDVSSPNNITNRVLVGHPGDINAVAISSDGKKIVSGGIGLVLWDISNPNNITHQAFGGNQELVMCVTFSPDGKKIASGSIGELNNLIVWDVSNPQNITHQGLVGHPYDVSVAAFSPDGKNMVSGCSYEQNNFIIWDMSNPHNITHQVLLGHLSGVRSVAWSSDGKYIVSGCYSSTNNLIMWDVSNPQNITHQVLGGYSQSVFAVAFSSDNKRVVAGGGDLQSNFTLWDITNPHNIIHLPVQQNFDTIRSIVFIGEGKKMVLGGAGKNNFILLTLLTDQEESLLKQVTGYNADQIRLMYRLCLKALKGEKITQSNEEQTVFKTLPQDMQKLLTDLLLNKGWFSGLW